MNTETIQLADNIITLNSNFTSGTPSENAGIEVLRGSSATKQFIWNESRDSWIADSHLEALGNIVAGTTFKQSNTAIQVLAGDSYRA